MGLDNLKGRQAAASKIVDKSTRKAHSSGTQQTCCVLELLPSSCPELLVGYFFQGAHSGSTRQ